MMPALDDATVRTHGRHVAGLIQEPDALPLVEDDPQVFRREDQLLGTAHRVGRVNRYYAADVGAGPQAQGSRQQELTLTL